MAAVTKSQTSDDPESSSESEEDDGVEESDRGPLRRLRLPHTRMYT